MAGALTACGGGVARVVTGQVAVGVARVVTDKAGRTVIRSSAGMKVARTAGDLAADALSDYLLGEGAPKDWRLVITRGEGTAARSEVYTVAADAEVSVRAKGTVLGTLSPAKRTLTVKAETTDTTVAIVDSPEDPVRIEGEYYPLPYQDFDFDTAKVTDEDADIEAGAFVVEALNGARFAYMEYEPGLGDCLTVPPSAWQRKMPVSSSLGDYCVITSQGRFGAWSTKSGDGRIKVWETEPVPLDD
ncbi:hypothetical protein ACFQ67_17945 [Streptomyces sp. NPDC056488]|uniref:hypothetical protein n=1 Tax=Streptomyces sp. NPDC056488 TaxID=3345836 RepID=UPI0036B598B4